MFERVKNALRKHPKWGFLAEMIGESDLPGMTMDVGEHVLLVNVSEAIRLDPETLAERVRVEFRKLALEGTAA